MRFMTVLVPILVFVIAAAASPSSADGPEVGAAAPDFSLTDQAGNSVSLSDFDSKVRVLEWTNPDCPFVKRHYEAGTMKKLAEKYRPEGVIWLTVNSTHYMDRAANASFHKAHGLPYPVLTDADGKVGKAYGARTTPHIFIIDGAGKVVYRGAIDDDPRGKTSGEETNYVAKALDQILAGESVTVPDTQPYGCSVKYSK